MYILEGIVGVEGCHKVKVKAIILEGRNII